MYAASDDPWGFDDRWYERRKYALTLAILTRPTYTCAFEPGCANGALTELLQARCDRDFEAGVWRRRHEPARATTETTMTGAPEATGEHHAH